MPRTLTSGTDVLSASVSVPSAYPFSMGGWVKPLATPADAHYIGFDQGTVEKNASWLGSNVAGGSAVGAYTADTAVGGPTVGTLSTSAWNYVGSSFASSTLNVYENASKNSGTNSHGTTCLPPTEFLIGRAVRPADAAMAHMYLYQGVALSDLAHGYLAAFGNPRGVGVTNYWWISASSGTETDQAGSMTLTVSGTSSAATDPNIAPFFTGTIAAQSYTQGSAITAVNLRTLFELQGYSAGSELWTGALMQVGTAGTATSASGSATSASQALTVAAIGSITAGMYVKVGSGSFNRVLFVSGNSILLGTAQTWNNADTVTPYPVSALSLSGLSVASNSYSGTPGSGAVGSYSNCFFRATNTTNAIGTFDSNLFPITVASSATTPSFSAGPTETSANTDGYTFGATSNQTATWWQGVYLRGSTAPSAANIIAGTGTGFVSHFSTALTLNVAGANTSTGLANPIYDVYHCLTNGNGNSAVVSFTGLLKAPPAGKQYVAVTLPTISAITKANPAAVTCTGHGFSTGNWVQLFGISGMTQLNGFFGSVTVVDANHFTLDNT